MKFAARRAARAAIVVAAALVSAAPFVPAAADQARIVPAQSDLQKRADTLLQGVTTGGGKVKYGAVEPGASKDGLVIKDVEITSPDNKTAKIETIEVRDFDWANPKEPRRMDVGIRKLVIAPDSLDAEVKDLGLSTLTINADIAYALDEAKKSFELSGIALDVVELGELTLKLKLTGIAASDLKGAFGEGEKKGKEGQDAQMKLLAQLSVVGASITFKDKSLTERLIRAEAKKKNISAADAKRKMLEELAEQKKQAQDDATREVIDLATKFLEKPGEVEVVANPSAPANVMATFMALMGSPAALKQMLGLTLAVR